MLWLVCAGAELSETSIAMAYVASTPVGVPLIWPVAAPRLKPVGNAPVRRHEYGGVPPEACRDTLYGTFVVAFASGDMVVITTGAAVRTLSTAATL